MSPLYGVRQRLTPSHGAGCDPWPWPWAALLAPWLSVTAPWLPVRAFALSASLATLALTRLASEFFSDLAAWRPFGCGARKKLFVASLVPKLYEKWK